MPTPPKKKKGRGKTVTTPEKAKISRYYQKLGGEDTRGAAVRTARKFGLTGSNGPARVKKYDEEVARNEARRKSVPGRPSTFNDDIAKEIDSTFKAKEEQTYRRSRYREDELVKVCKKAWRAMEPVKILFGFEMRKDCAHEAIANGGLIDGEGKGRGGSKRVLESPEYAQLRMHLKI